MFNSRIHALFAGFVIFTAAFLCPLEAEIRISEFMSSNQNSIADEDGVREDWIEIQNTGSSLVDLGGWGLTDDPALPFQYTFAPGSTIAPGGYLLVWASGKNRPGQQKPVVTPNQVAGLVTWLRADDGSLTPGQPVDTWQDSSGMGNHATQATISQRPVVTANAINGLPALTFTRSSSQQLFLPTSSFQGMSDLSNFTFLAVAKWTGGTSSGIFGGYRGTNSSNSGSLVFEIIQSTGSLRLRIPNSIDSTSTAAVTLNQWSLLGATLDQTAAKATILRDGSILAESAGLAGTTLLANYQRLPIGSSFDNSRTFGGQIAEVILYNRAISSLERASLERHFAQKYGLTVATPSGSTPPHTNFRIASGGETLVLTRPDGSTADLIDPIALPPNISYGRWGNAPETRSMLLTATPGAANPSEPYIEPPAPVTFSHAPGLHTQNFSLSLAHSDPSAVIVYTLDGSDPDINRLNGSSYRLRTTYNTGALVDMSTNSLTYQNPIPVSDRSSQPNRVSLMTSTSDSNPTYLPVAPVKKATVVRARAYVNGRPGPASAATYFVSPNAAFDYPVSLVSIFFNEADFFDYDQGIYVAGVDHVTSTGGRICNWGNFNRNGISSERPGHFQLYENGALTLDQAVGFRLHGNCSRRNAFKSLRVIADQDYETRDVFDQSLFSAPVPDATVPGNTAHKALLLRTPSINEVAFARLYQSIYGGVGGRLRPVIKFFNGEYWGLSYLRDRLDENYLSFHYDLDPNNLTLVNIKYGYEVGSTDQRVFDLDHGIPSDMTDFWAMRNFITSNSMAVSANYEQARTMLDTRSFIDHLILKIFAGDDHYAPEYVFWRAREPQDDSFGDGRWRVMVKDFDSSLFTPNYVTGLANGTHPRAFGFQLFQSLLANPSFRNDFINRFADLLNTHFQPTRFQSIINAAYEEAQPVWGEMSARWNNVAFSNPSRPFTIAGRDALINWSNVHPPRQRDHIRSHFGIATNVNLTLSVSDPSHGHIRVNSVEIAGNEPGLSAQPYPWTGTYFHNIPITLSARPAAGYRLAGWRLNGGASFYSTAAEIPLTLTAATTVDAVFEPLSSIHQWNFESASAFSLPSQTLGGGAALGTIPAPTTEVIRSTASQSFTSAHLRVNNPIGASLVWSLPTTGFENLVLSWKSRRSGLGPGMHTIEYTADGTLWNPLATHSLADSAPQQRSIDLTGITLAANNPLFAIRFTFSQGAGGIAGNARFDDLSVSGTLISGGLAPASILFDAPPAFTSSGTALPDVTIRLLDASGLPAVSFSGPVTLSLIGQGALAGNLTVNAINGTAIFSGLSITGHGLFQLTASAAGLGPVPSTAIRSIALTELCVPRFLQGGNDANGENSERVPYAWRGRIEGLAPSATYRFANRAVLSSDSSNSDGAGNMIFAVSPSENWIRSVVAPSFLSVDLTIGHSTFTAENDGTFTGWFLTEPTGNVRFTPGNDLHFRLLLNDGNSGESVAHVLTTTNHARVIRFGTQLGDATGIIGQSPTAARRMVLLYDDATGSTRPLSVVPVEITGAEVDTRYVAFYRDSVANLQSRWGSLLPNDLASGLRRIEYRTATAEASLIDARVAPDGFALTINPAGGASSPILLDADAGLPVFLPSNDAVWHSASNWSSGIIPNASGATAIIDAPSSADRTVQIDASTTIGRLHFRQASSNFQHSIRNISPTAALAFHGGDREAVLRVDGSGGSGHIDVDFTNPISLSTDLILLINQSEGGHQQHGALRLQNIWNGSGGLIKQGPGVATLSGDGKNFTGPLVVEQGVLRIESQAVPVATSGLIIQPGGQLCLISAGTTVTSAQHNFGGGIIQIGGTGRGGDPLASPEQGILGAMRYDPATPDSRADLLTPLSLTAATHLHVEGASNFLRLHGEITGNDHLISKTGSGTLTLIAASPNASPISVLAGTLSINNNYPAPISLVHDDAILTGTGSTGPISGIGSIFPGVGGLTAPSVSAGRIAARLLTPGLDGNESLILTHPSQPFVSEPQFIDLFLPASRLTGNRYHGGIVVDPEFSLSTTQVRLFVPDSTGEIIHYGIHYRAATAVDMLTLSTVTLPEGLTLEVLQRGDAQSFTQWRNLHFADPDARANPNISGPSVIDSADGIAHLMRYAHGIAPGEPVVPWLPRMIRSNQDGIAFRFRYDSNKSGIAWIVRSSRDLNDWSNSVFDSRTQTPPAVTTDGWTELVVPQAETEHFFRLEVRELP